MTENEKQQLKDIIDSYEWKNNTLYVWINLMDIPEFTKLFHKYQTIFDEPIHTVLKEYSICIPNFDDVLKCIMFKEDIDELFN